MKYTLIDVNNEDGIDTVDDNNNANNNNNNSTKNNNTKKRRTQYIHSPYTTETTIVNRTTTSNSNKNENNNELLYESFCSLDINYTNSIVLNDIYTIYLAYEYIPKELTYTQFQNRITNNSTNITNNTNRNVSSSIQIQSDQDENKQYTFNDVCTILESYFIQNSMYNTEQYWYECFHLFTSSSQQQQSTTCIDNSNNEQQQQQEEEEHQDQNQKQLVLLLPQDIVNVSNEICNVNDTTTTTAVTNNNNEEASVSTTSTTTTSRVSGTSIQEKQNVSLLHINQSLAERMINYCINNNSRHINQQIQTTPTTTATATAAVQHHETLNTNRNGLTINNFVTFFCKYSSTQYPVNG